MVVFLNAQQFSDFCHRNRSKSSKYRLELVSEKNKGFIGGAYPLQK